MEAKSELGSPSTFFNRVTRLPVKTQGPLVERQAPCSFCQEKSGYMVSKGEFWDLAPFSFVRCPKCDLTQVDPMFNDEIMSKGCEALYLMDSAREGAKNLSKNMMRSFRRGAYFGFRLKKHKIRPQRILEIGPGNGFFSAGLKQVFPEAHISCLDIVEEVVQDMERIHGFTGLVGPAEKLDQLGIEKKFDLIVARDILEHVSKPDLVIRKINSVLADHGHFHFITPNGFEDIWGAHCCWKLNEKPFELLLNHVNYFPPQALKQQLAKEGLRPIEYYIYDFNGTRWGFGRKLSQKLAGASSTRRSAQSTIDKFIKQERFNSEQIQSPKRLWWTKVPFLFYLYCMWKEHPHLRINAEVGIGHEISGLFKKSNLN